MQKEWEDIINNVYFNYSGCIIEKKGSIFYWNNKPIGFTLKAAQKYIDEALERFGKSIVK